jgi:hypothetical protein
MSVLDRPKVSAQTCPFHDYSDLTSSANALLKRARDIQKALEPKSRLHVEASLVKLRQQVVLLQDLAHELPAGSIQEVEDDLRMAIKVE